MLESNSLFENEFIYVLNFSFGVIQRYKKSVGQQVDDTQNDPLYFHFILIHHLIRDVMLHNQGRF